ncbi:MAG: HAMP domain-containing sensor histidine kinase [Elusimicrobiota bacterium]
MDATRPHWEEMVIYEAPHCDPAPAKTADRNAVAKAVGRPEPKVQAAYLTHELRAPVTSIRLGLEILSEQIVDRLRGDEKQILSLAIRNTVRLEGLVDDIMDYSKIAAGKLAIVKEPCNARTLVDDAADSLRAMATAKGVKIAKECAPLLPRCAAESRRVVQVLMNLISNAIKFTPARGLVTISVCEGKYEHVGTLLFKVKDTGCGIAHEELENVFGLFEQACGSRRRQAQGTGLGLTLARAMVELHGGRIWAESWKGSGSTFCFTIPIAPVDMYRPVEAYAKPLELHGLLLDVARRLNAFVAMFV